MTTIRPCPACAGTATSPSFDIPEQMFGSGESFRYVECATCRTVFIVEVPDDLAKYYDTDAYYSFDGEPETLMGRPGIAQAVALIGRSVLFGPHQTVVRLASVSPMRQVRTLVAMFASVRLAGLPRGRHTRILDVGAGAGTLVYALGLAGMEDVTGIDPFAEGDKQVGRRGRLLRRDLADVEGEFDLLMMHHSLEHVPDPLLSLKLAKKCLSAEGRVLVRMPTVSSHAYEAYGTSWIACDAPRHLSLFSREGVERLCSRAGFEVSRVVDDSNEVQFWASEQYRAGVPLTAENSHFTNPRKSMFSARQIRAWRRESARLNRAGRGDQAAWVLTPN